MKKNIDNSLLNIKYIFVLFISNLTLFLLVSAPDQKLERKCSNNTHKRKGYISIKIFADLKTDISNNMPITITNNRRSFRIKNAFVLKEFAVENHFVSDNGLSKSFLIEVPKKDFHLISRAKNLEIYSHNANINLKTGIEKYEINF